MHKSARIQTALLSNRLIAAILDICSIFLSAFLCSLLLLYTVFLFFGYTTKINQIKAIEEEYNLNLVDVDDYKVYESAIKNIYFNIYPEEIEKHYKDSYGKDYTIEHIYNINILRLPAEPTYDNYKNDFYQYSQNSDGSFAVDTIATKIDGKGYNFERGIFSLYDSEYKGMSELVELFNNEYLKLNVETYSYECYSRLIGFIIAFTVYIIVLPLRKSPYQTFWMKRLDLSYVSYKTGYNLKKGKIIARYIISFIIPLVGFIFATKYSLVILILGYFLLDFLLMIFSNNNLNISDKVLKIETCSYSDSLLFDDPDDEKHFLDSAEGKVVTDDKYVKVLEGTEEIGVPTDL